jgi:oxalate decarboxylase
MLEKRLQEKLDQLKEATKPEPIRSDGCGALDLGPRNLKRDLENPDMLVPPATDKGLIPNLKFSFSDTNIYPWRLVQGNYKAGTSHF